MIRRLGFDLIGYLIFVPNTLTCKPKEDFRGEGGGEEEEAPVGDAAAGSMPFLVASRSAEISSAPAWKALELPGSKEEGTWGGNSDEAECSPGGASSLLWTHCKLGADIRIAAADPPWLPEN